MVDSVEEALEAVRATLRLHQGGIERVSWDPESGELVLRFTGACSHCSLSSMTLKQGVGVMLCERIPGIRKIRTISSHD